MSASISQSNHMSFVLRAVLGFGSSEAESSSIHSESTSKMRESFVRPGASGRHSLRSQRPTA